MLTYWVDSSGRRKVDRVDFQQPLVKGFGGSLPAKRLSRPGVEGRSYGSDRLGAMCAQVCTLWEVLAQQSIGVLIGAALPRALGITIWMPLAILSSACWAISAPWSHVRERRSS
jgi:hypothetical protein